MSFDRADYLNYRPNTSPRGGSDVTGLRMLTQAEVHAENLMGTEEWDRFLSYLQAAVEATLAQRNALIRKFCESRDTDYKTLISLKLDIERCEGRMEAWRAAIELPVDIRREGGKARGLLERLDHDKD